MRIAIDSDDAGLDLKAVICEHLARNGINFEDLDFLRDNNCNYADIGFNLAMRVKRGEFDRGILICGTGIGMAIIANKVEGIYAGTCHDTFSAERLRKSNNAQIITVGARVIGSELAKSIIDAWLGAEFEGGGSLPKVETVRLLEKGSFHVPSG